MALDKHLNPGEFENRIYEQWERSGLFACDVTSSKKPFTIMMPPPNVTGSLHIGHALTFTIQDILIRYHRMRGKDVLWQPGTDHAGIATQLVVERQLLDQNLTRRELGRSEFIKKVWAWKDQSGGTITRQLRRLGASCDWGRERFTMDEGLTKAVLHEFVALYRSGLIYKDRRLVNWDPKMLTAVSDLEVESKEIKGQLWYLKYPIEGSDETMVVATTRPETLLGDTAVAVHPDNEKLKNWIGRHIRLPLTDRLIPIIGDVYADPEKGTGAVKITPAHDFNDFIVGKRHGLPMINVFDRTACLNDQVPARYRGLERFAARKIIVADLEEQGFLEKTEPHTHMVPHGDRSGVPIEPWLSEQWYCDAKSLAQDAIKAVEDGRTKFYPEQWTNTYYAWMRNIEPWCISRQLWWGHQIPAWYGPDEKVFVAETEAEAEREALQHYGKVVALRRDDDVLDTWFSSALWPFSTLSWPEQNPYLNRYYPSDVLVTGFDIIFFWVARMMMMGMHFMKDVPFHAIYMHSIVRDERGHKMSKVKGNVIDPLTIIDQYGCDALRFTLANLSTPGRDIRLATARIEGSRNFMTKLWNASRYCQMNACEIDPTFQPKAVTHLINRWMLSEVDAAENKVRTHLDAFRFDHATQAVYDFVWNTFCDWYLEFTKPLLASGDEALIKETRATTSFVLDVMLHLLHPFTPFVTEELYAAFGGRALLMSRSWPQMNGELHDAQAVSEISFVIKIINTVRTIRSELNVPAAAQIPLHVKEASGDYRELLKRHETIIKKMARLTTIESVHATAPGAAQAVLDGCVLILPLADVINLAVERERLTKERERLTAEIRKLDGKLGNKEFVDRAPPEVVEEQRERKSEAEAILRKLEAAVASLSA